MKYYGKISDPKDLVTKKWVEDQINDGTLTLQVAGTTKATFTANDEDNVTFDVTTADLGLSQAMKFIGITTTDLTDGATTNPIIIGGESVTVTDGNVALTDTSVTTLPKTWFVWANSKWNKLGDAKNYKIIQSPVTDPTASGNATAFIDSISQNENGDITVTKKNVELPSDFTGATSSTAGTHGLVKAPAAGDQAKFLRGDATWATVDISAKATIVYSVSEPETKTEGDYWVDIYDESTEYTITTTLTNVTGSASNPTSIKDEEEATLLFTVPTGYNLPDTVTVSGADYTWTKASGTLVLSNPWKNIDITISGVPIEYTIIPTLTNVTGDPSNPTVIATGETKNLLYTAPTGYNLPSTITVTGADYTWTKASGTLVLSNPTDTVEIEITGKATSFNITCNLTNISEDEDNVHTIAPEQEVELVLNSYLNYKLPETITVSGTVTSTYNKTKGTITLTNPDSDIIITAAGVSSTSAANCLYFEGNQAADSTVSMSIAGTMTNEHIFKYSSDNGNTWKKFIPGTTTVTIGNGSKAYFRGISSSGVSESESNYYYFVTTGSLKCLGNIVSLKDNGQCETTTIPSYCFYSLFKNNTSLVTAPSMPATTVYYYSYASMFEGCENIESAITLPATDVQDYSYNAMFKNCKKITSASLGVRNIFRYGCQQMFYGCTALTTVAFPNSLYSVNTYSCSEMFYNCTALTTVPSLAATYISDYCYYYMFYGCTSLITPPALSSAETAPEDCYACMFQGCTSLTTAPALPSTTMNISCYARMFFDCKALTTAPTLPATTLANGCYQQMFAGCTGLTTPPALPATTLITNCYNSMFQYCTSLYVSDASVSGTATQEWRIPTSGNFVLHLRQLLMFEGCAGTRSTDNLDDSTTYFTYYTQNTPV